MTREEALEFAESIQADYDSTLQRFLDVVVKSLKDVPKYRKKAKRWKRKYLELLKEISELIEQGKDSGVHHDFRSWQFIKDLEKMVGEK